MGNAAQNCQYVVVSCNTPNSQWSMPLIPRNAPVTPCHFFPALLGSCWDITVKAFQQSGISSGSGAHRPPWQMSFQTSMLSSTGRSFRIGYSDAAHEMNHTQISSDTPPFIDHFVDRRGIRRSLSVYEGRSSDWSETQSRVCTATQK